MPVCPVCGNKIQLKLIGHNRKYHCGECTASLVEDKSRNIILYLLTIVNITVLPVFLSFFLDKIFVIVVACILMLVIINYVPKLKVDENESE